MNQREEFFRDRGFPLHTSRGAMDPVSGLAFGSLAGASLKNSSTLDTIVRAQTLLREENPRLHSAGEIVSPGANHARNQPSHVVL